MVMINSEEEEHGELEQKLVDLIKYWDFRKTELKPRSTSFLKPSSPPSFCWEIMDYSPRSLMMMTTSPPPPPGKWNVRNNYLALEDMLMGTTTLSNHPPSDHHSDNDDPTEEASGEIVTIADFVHSYNSPQDDEIETVEGKAETSEVVSPDSCSTSSSFVCDECLKKEVTEELENVTDTGTTVAAAAATALVTAPLVIGFHGRRWTNIGFMLLCVIVAVVVGLTLSGRKSDFCVLIYLSFRVEANLTASEASQTNK